MELWRDAGLMLLSGLGIPVLAALNARLGQGIGSVTGAAAVLFAVALCVTLLTVLAFGTGPSLARLPGQPWHLFLAGGLVAFYVLSVTATAPRFGLGNAVLCVLLGQMLAAAVIDHLGLFGAIRQALTPLRATGIAVMAVGLVVARLG